MTTKDNDLAATLIGAWPGDDAPVAVVTGAARGIGRAVADRFASNGVRVVVNDLEQEAADQAAREITESGGQALGVGGDVSDLAAVKALAAIVKDWAGRVDVLVNNAGISDVVLPTVEQDVDRWQLTVNVLLRGPYICSKTVAEQFMLPAGFGRIVNIASIAALSPLPMRNAYAPSKAGVAMMTKTMAAEWARHGITVNAIAPGYIETDMIRDLTEAGRIDEITLRRRIPMGALGKPDDIARAVCFLAAPASSYVTGVLLPVDGGWMSFGAAGDAFPADEL